MMHHSLTPGNVLPQKHTRQFPMDESPPPHHHLIRPVQRCAVLTQLAIIRLLYLHFVYGDNGVSIYGS